MRKQWFVFVCIFVWGKNNTLIGYIIYLLIGFLGLPVFAGFKAFTEISAFISDLPDLLSIFGSVTSEIEAGIDNLILSGNIKGWTGNYCMASAGISSGGRVIGGDVSAAGEGGFVLPFTAFEAAALQENANDAKK